MLLSIGPVVFDLVNNVHEYERETAEDFARKDVVGARKPFESVGHGDDIITFRGRVFPEKLGGAGAVEALRQMQAQASPQMVIRGDGMVLGFFLVTSIGEHGSYLDGAGKPRMIETTVKCERCDAPSAAVAFGSLISLFG